MVPPCLLPLVHRPMEVSGVEGHQNAALLGAIRAGYKLAAIDHIWVTEMMIVRVETGTAGYLSIAVGPPRLADNG